MLTRACVPRWSQTRRQSQTVRPSAGQPSRQRVQRGMRSHSRSPRQSSANATALDSSPSSRTLRAAITRTASDEPGSWPRCKLPALCGSRSLASESKFGWVPEPQRQRAGPFPATADKSTSRRVHQLKSGQAAIVTHLERIGDRRSDNCWWCGADTRGSSAQEP